MPVRFECPSCKTGYEVADDLAGKAIMCRGCGARGQVPAPAPAPAASPPAGWTRRRVLLWSAAGVGSMVTGAVLARNRRFFRMHFSEPPPDRPRPTGKGKGGKDKGGKDKGDKGGEGGGRGKGPPDA